MAYHNPGLERLLHAIQIAKNETCNNIIGHKKECKKIIFAIIDIEQAVYKIKQHENGKIALNKPFKKQGGSNGLL